MAAPAGAALRLRLLFRMLRVGELLALAVLLSWSSARAPSAAAAAARAAGSLLFSPRFVFVLGNAIVLLLLAISKRQAQDPSTSSSSSAGAGSQIPAAAASFPSFPAPGTIAAEPVVPMVPAAPAAPAAAKPMATVFEEEEVAKPPAPVPAAAEAEESRRVVGSNGKARAPRRSRSEKMGRAASPETMMTMMPAAMMRRSESDNGRRPRRRSSATARDVAGADGRGWGKEDEDEFRRMVEAFIARQTRFHREEESSMAVVFPGAGGRRDTALVVVE